MFQSDKPTALNVSELSTDNQQWKRIILSPLPHTHNKLGLNLKSGFELNSTIQPRACKFNLREIPFKFLILKF